MLEPHEGVPVGYVIMLIEIQDTAFYAKIFCAESVSHSGADMDNPIGVMRR